MDNKKKEYRKKAKELALQNGFDQVSYYESGTAIWHIQHPGKKMKGVVLVILGLSL